MLYDITSADNAYLFLQMLLNTNGEGIITEFIVECKADVDTFIKKHQSFLQDWNVEDTEFIVIHVTSNSDNCSEIKKQGIMNLQRVLTEDTAFRRFLFQYEIEFDIQKSTMRIGCSSYSVDYEYYKKIKAYDLLPQDKELKEIGRKLYFDPQINGFFYSRDVKDYGTQIHERPEFLSNIACLKKGLLKLEKDWKSICKGYIIKYRAFFDQFASFTFYDHENEDIDDSRNNRMAIKAKLLSIALNVTFNRSVSQEFAYMKRNVTIPPSQIIECSEIQ